MHGLKEGTALPNALLAQAWLQHRKEVEGKDNDDLLRALSFELESDHPLLAREQQTMPVQLDCANGMVLEFDEQCVLPLLFELKLNSKRF